MEAFLEWLLVLTGAFWGGVVAFAIWLRNRGN